jgi:hypothetical protein
MDAADFLAEDRTDCAETDATPQAMATKANTVTPIGLIMAQRAVM